MTERECLIQKYKQIKSKWDKNQNIKRLLPDIYEDMCKKLEALKQGCPYTIKDVTKECISVYGALLCDAQMGYDSKHPFAYSQHYQKGVKRFLNQTTNKARIFLD